MRPSCRLPRGVGARGRPDRSADDARRRAPGRARERRGFFELDSRMRRLTGPRSRSGGTTPTARSGSSAPPLRSHRPGGCWVAEDGTGSSDRDVVPPRGAVVPGDVRRPAGHRDAGSANPHGGRDGPRPRLHARDAVGLLGPAGRRLYHQAGSSCTRRCTSPEPWTGRRSRAGEGARGQRVRHRADGLLDRGARGAGHGPDHGLMLDLAAAGQRHLDRLRLRLPQRARVAGLLAASNRRTATRLLWRRWPRAGGGDGRARHRREPVVLDVGFAARLELHQEGYLGLRG